jgi:hypothetical protein
VSRASNCRWVNPRVGDSAGTAGVTVPGLPCGSGFDARKLPVGAAGLLYPVYLQMCDIANELLHQMLQAPPAAAWDQDDDWWMLPFPLRLQISSKEARAEMERPQPRFLPANRSRTPAARGPGSCIQVSRWRTARSRCFTYCQHCLKIQFSGVTDNLRHRSVDTSA